MKKVELFLSNALTCGYSVLTVFSWLSIDMKETFVRSLWWVATVIICIGVVISLGIWIATESENA